MTYSADDFTWQLQSLLPPGKAWTRDQNADTTKVLKGLSPELARVQARADDLYREFNPGEAVELLPEYENVNGLTATGTVSQRQAALIAKLADDKGHNPADYVAWALSKYGLNITVRRMPLKPLRAGFRAGTRARAWQWAHAFIVEYMADTLSPAANSFNSWSASSGSVTANAANGPDATATADLLSGSTPTLTAAFGAASQVQFSVWLRAASAVQNATMSIGANTYDFPVSLSWRRYEMRAGGTSGVVGLATNGNVYAWGAYVGTVNQAFENEFGNSRQQSQSVPLYRVIGDRPED